MFNVGCLNLYIENVHCRKEKAWIPAVRPHPKDVRRTDGMNALCGTKALVRPDAGGIGKPPYGCVKRTVWGCVRYVAEVGERAFLFLLISWISYRENRICLLSYKRKAFACVPKKGRTHFSFVKKACGCVTKQRAEDVVRRAVLTNEGKTTTVCLFTRNWRNRLS